LVTPAYLRRIDNTERGASAVGADDPGLGGWFRRAKQPSDALHNQ
jgi:hypothetical protein